MPSSVCLYPLYIILKMEAICKGVVFNVEYLCYFFIFCFYFWPFELGDALKSNTHFMPRWNLFGLCFLKLFSKTVFEITKNVILLFF